MKDIKDIDYICDEPLFDFEKIEDKDAYRVRRKDGVTLSGSIEIPSAYNGLPVTEIDSCAFEFTHISNVKIPKTVSVVGNAAFSECESLETVVFTGSVDEINDYTFYNCAKLQSVVMPKTARSIGENAFGLCASLEEIEFPDGVENIWDEAFCCCTSLRRITLPPSLTHVGNGAFTNCMCLAEIINNSSLPIKAGSALYGGIGYYAATVHTGQSRIKTCGDWVFCEAENGNALIDYAGGGECAVLPEKYRGEEYAIHSYALMLKNIRAVKMPNSVQKIGKGAFWGCTYLTDVSLPDGLKSLSENLFSRCASLEAINIPASVTSIKNFAFSLCTSLRTVEIPAGVREIGKGVFHGCRLLENVVLPEGVDTVANMLFAQCGGLRSVTLPSSVKHIGMGAFFKCYKLDEIIYRGTISQWNAIEKELDTEACSGYVRIVCADGEFTAERRFA